MGAREEIQNLTRDDGYAAMTDVGQRAMASQEIANAQAQLVANYPVFTGISAALRDLNLAPSTESAIPYTEPEKFLIWLGFLMGASALMLAVETAEIKSED